MQALTFFLEDQLYTIDTKYVEEIKEAPKLTEVPKAGNRVRGLMNLRGSIIPVLNMKTVLGIESKSGDNKLIIIEDNDQKIAFTVDDVDEILEIGDDCVESIGGNEFDMAVKIGDNIATMINAEVLFKNNI